MTKLLKLSSDLIASGHADFMTRLTFKGGVRGMTDPSSDEWGMMSDQERYGFWIEFCMAHVGVKEVTDAGMEIMENAGYPHDTAVSATMAGVGIMLLWRLENDR